MSENLAAARGKELGLPSRLTYHVIHVLAQLLALAYWRVYARNRTKLPRRGGVIISPVHRSNLDVPLLGATCPRRLRYLAKGSLFTSKFWGWFLTVVGGVPLDRGAKVDRGALKAATEVLERGEALVVFPEGERKAGPTVHPMMDGAVWLSVKSGCPILPVGIGGSERSMGKGRRIPRPSRIAFLYGDPIPPPVALDGSRVSRAQMREHSDALRVTLQALFDQAQAQAGTEQRAS